MYRLSSSEFEMHPFFEITPDLVCIASKEGFFRKVNYSVVNKLEYTEQELFARPIASFIHPEDKELTARKRTDLINGTPLVNFQNRYVTKNEGIVWLDWTSIYLPDREIVFAIAKDVTERKKVEKEIEEKYRKFKSLTTHFKTSIEKERKYLAIELHEELAQLASVVKMDIDWLSINTPDLPAASKSRMDHALGVSELLINAIRRISYSISPNMLDDLGLNETLKWLCEEFAILNGIPCLFHSTYNTEHLTHEIQLDLFRICQESLTNVMYHAEANKVEINIAPVGDKVCLSISDDGKGFEINKQKKTSGLTGMRKRAVSINGELIIKSEIGKGTEVCFTIAPQLVDQD
jgi:PAS domain S-box-containing protein